LTNIDFASVPYTALIVDIGDVLCSWSAHTPTTVLSDAIRPMRRSITWFSYEKGRLTERECHSALANEFGFHAKEVSKAFAETRTSVATDMTMVSLLRAWKAAQPHLLVYAMSNVSSPDWAFLRKHAKLDELGIFDRVFSSAEAGARKPELPFYHYVVKEAGCKPSSTLFMDDKVENVTSARSLGLQGLVFSGQISLLKHLAIFEKEPSLAGQRYLRQNTARHSITNTGRTINENFAELLIMEATGDRSLVEYIEHSAQFNFFRG
jgi:HAD superfamily hydrolase (TIGR01509 family)